MKKMARIETIMFLREVELFHFCTAEEILRIAAIARLKRFREGDVIYKIGDTPEGMFCVVEGAARLSDEGTVEIMDPGHAFGYVEILSGKRRGMQAVADVDTSVLFIEEEDFFDLLSNNIDIVKSLFRHMAEIFAAKQRGGVSP